MLNDELLRVIRIQIVDLHLYSQYEQEIDTLQNSFTRNTFDRYFVEACKQLKKIHDITIQRCINNFEIKDKRFYA